MPGSAYQTQNIEGKEQRLKQFRLHFAERRAGIDMQVNAREAQRIRVESDVGKGNPAGPALRRIHPIAGPRIAKEVGLPPIPNVNTVSRVEENRQPHAEKRTWCA